MWNFNIVPTAATNHPQRVQIRILPQTIRVEMWFYLTFNSHALKDTISEFVSLSIGGWDGECWWLSLRPITFGMNLFPHSRLQVFQPSSVFIKPSTHAPFQENLCRFRFWSFMYHLKQMKNIRQDKPWQDARHEMRWERNQQQQQQHRTAINHSAISIPSCHHPICKFSICFHFFLPSLHFIHFTTTSSYRPRKSLDSYAVHTVMR